MKRKLLELIPFAGCPHEFSWPRRAQNSHHYQVCLLCGAEYEYDWKTMQRSKIVSQTAVAFSESHAAEAATRKERWRPRERRLGMELPIQFREQNSVVWQDGIIENISRSGVRFRSEQTLKPTALVQMIFEMPQEISGRARSKVFCNAHVVREVTSSKTVAHITLAAGIVNCHYLQERVDCADAPAKTETSNGNHPLEHVTVKSASGSACRTKPRLPLQRGR